MTTETVCFDCQEKDKEIGRLKQIIETGESFLKSANYDVKRLSKYADKLEKERDRLRKTIKSIQKSF